MLALCRSALPRSTLCTTTAAIQSRLLTRARSVQSPVQLPLSEREVCSREPATALLDCWQHCREVSETCAAGFVDDDAPSVSELHVRSL